MQIKRLVDKYMSSIDGAAREASSYFTRQNAIIHPFPGCSTYLSPGDCKQIYIDLLQDLVSNSNMFACRYNMFVIAKKIGENQDGAHFEIKFGMIF